MGLDASTCSECLPVATCDFEPPEHVPRTSVRAHTYLRRGVRADSLRAPESKAREKTGGGKRKKMPMCKKNILIQSNIYDRRIPRSLQK